MPKKKSIPGQSIRNFWSIKPMTRIHDNDIRKNETKQRQASRHVVRKELNDVSQEKPKIKPPETERLYFI